MLIVTLDMETFYDDEYSLSKLTTEAYVRDPRFEAIICGIKISDKPRIVVEKHQIEPMLRRIPWDRTALLCHNTPFDGFILEEIYGIRPALYMDTLSMARPWHHDNIGLSLKKLVENYGITIDGRTKGDEVINAKGLHYEDFSRMGLEQYKRYCGDDVDLTHGLFLKLMEKTPKAELLRIDAVLRTFLNPQIQLDQHLLTEHLSDTRARRQALLDRVASIAGKDALSSNTKFLKVLELFGGHLPPTLFKTPTEYEQYKATLTTPHVFDIPTKVRPATPTEEKKKGITGDVTVVALSKKDDDFLALLNSSDEDLVAVCEARMGTKSTIAESRAERLLDSAPRGAYPISLQYYAAHTGRLGGGGEKSNPQNYPKPKEVTRKDIGFKCVTPKGVAILLNIDNDTAITTLGAFKKRDTVTLTVRHCLVAPPGYKLVVVDASQIEARIVAWVAGQYDLIEGFRNKEDIYSDFASSVYGFKCNKKDNPIERFVGKTCILGLGYGMGHVKLQDTLAVGVGDTQVVLALDETQRIVNIYRKEKYPAIPKLWRTAEHALEAAYYGDRVAFGPNNLLTTGDKCIWLPNGMPIRYPRLHRDEADGSFSYWGKRNGHYQMVNIYGGKTTENFTQALAGIHVAEVWVRVNRIYTKEYLRTVYPMVMQVHDELVAIVPESEAESFKAFMIDEMRRPPFWGPDLPLDAEGDVGHSYADAK